MPLSKIQFGNTGNRNLIINGDFQIFQRATSATNPGGGYDTADRWRSSQNSSGLGNYTAEQSTDTPDGFGFSYKLTKSGSTTIGSGVSAYIQQYIEGKNVQHLNYGGSSAKKVTASFHVKSSVTGTYGVRLGDGEAGKHNVQTFTISSANTWERKVVTFNGDTSTALANDNSAEFDFAIVLGAGSTYQTSSTNTWASGDKLSTSSQTQWPQTDGATFFMTGIQLEVGDVATEFEHESFDESLIKCQRYYQLIGRDFSDTSPTTAFGWGYTSSGSATKGMLQFERRMRIKPTFTQSTDQNLDFKTNAGPGAVHSSNAFTSVVTSETSAEFTQQNHASNFGGAGQPYYLKWNGVQGTGLAASVQLDAELG